MPSGTIVDNGISEVFSIPKGPITIAFGGVFGGATVTVQININSKWETLLDETTAVEYTVPNAFSYALQGGTLIRFSTASVTPGTTEITYDLNYN